MLTVFIPSSPTAFSGYVVVVSRDAVVELPLTVEEAMRLLVSGGVIAPVEKPAGPPMPLADVEPVDEQPDKAASSSPPPQRSAAAQLANP
jgi:uncharacterized membrane protein